MAYITDRKVAEIPALATLDSAGITAALADADRVYAYVRRNEWITDSDLRAYGDRNGIDPDRMNTALAILAEAGRLITIPEATSS